MALSSPSDRSAPLPAPAPLLRDVPAGTGPDGIDRRTGEAPGPYQRWLRTRIRERRLSDHLDRALDGVAHVLHDRWVGANERSAGHVVTAPSGIWVVAPVHARLPDTPTEDDLADVQQHFQDAVMTFRDTSAVRAVLAEIGFDWVRVRPAVCIASPDAPKVRSDGDVPVLSRRRLVHRLLGAGPLRPCDIRTVASALQQRLAAGHHAR